MKNNTLILLILTLIITSNCKSQSCFFDVLVDSAKTLTKDMVTYDPAYFSIDYPNGDIPSDKGVCTDVIIRAYRKVGIDLQLEVHEDMKDHFHSYPNIWGLKSTDRNIDHRRVPNLKTYFERYGKTKPISFHPSDYIPGDIVVWDLGGGTTHIGIVIDQKSRDERRNLIVHNIGAGQVKEDILFDYKIIGHYRYKK